MPTWLVTMHRIVEVSQRASMTLEADKEWQAEDAFWENDPDWHNGEVHDTIWVDKPEVLLLTEGT